MFSQGKDSCVASAGKRTIPLGTCQKWLQAHLRHVHMLWPSISGSTGSHVGWYMTFYSSCQAWCFLGPSWWSISLWLVTGWRDVLLLPEQKIRILLPVPAVVLGINASPLVLDVMESLTEKANLGGPWSEHEWECNNLLSVITHALAEMDKFIWNGSGASARSKSFSLALMLQEEKQFT